MPRWTLELSVRVIDNQARVATSLLESTTPGYAVWDLRGYLRPTNQLTILAGVENLTDKQYREYMDFRSRGVGALEMFQPGINFYFATEMNY